MNFLLSMQLYECRKLLMGLDVLKNIPSSLIDLIENYSQLSWVPFSSYSRRPCKPVCILEIGDEVFVSLEDSSLVCVYNLNGNYKRIVHTDTTNFQGFSEYYGKNILALNGDFFVKTYWQSQLRPMFMAKHANKMFICNTKDREIEIFEFDLETRTSKCSGKFDDIQKDKKLMKHQLKYPEHIVICNERVYVFDTINKDEDEDKKEYQLCKIFDLNGHFIKVLDYVVDRPDLIDAYDGMIFTVVNDIEEMKCKLSIYDHNLRLIKMFPCDFGCVTVISVVNNNIYMGYFDNTNNKGGVKILSLR